MAITDNRRLAAILGDIDHLLVAVLDPALKSLGLSRTHWHLLRLLSDGEGHPMKEVSQALALPGGSATRVVDRLVEDMLVYRRNDSMDRRRIVLYLADPGREVLDRIAVALEEDTAAVLAGRLSDEIAS